MNKTKHYKVTLMGGSMGVARSRKSLKRVLEAVTRKYGSDNVSSVREATEDDVDWFKSMGGAIWEV